MKFFFPKQQTSFSSDTVNITKKKEEEKSEKEKDKRKMCAHHAGTFWNLSSFWDWALLDEIYFKNSL